MIDFNEIYSNEVKIFNYTFNVSLADVKEIVPGVKKLNILEAVKFAKNKTADGFNYHTHFEGTVFCRDKGRWLGVPNLANCAKEKDGMTKYAAYPFGFGTSKRLSNEAEVFFIEKSYAGVNGYIKEIEAIGK